MDKKRILAIDYGKKRWGLATCDELLVVFTLPAATQNSFEERYEHLKKLIESRKINQLVVGMPLTLEGGKSQLTLDVERFISEKLKPLGVPIQAVDEGLSSFEAESSIPKPKVKKGRPARDGTVDSKAAALILEDYLSQNRSIDF